MKIKIDSREVQKGDTFVALSDGVNDGHKYIEAAIQNGASKIIAERGNYDVKTIIVKDTREYLADYLKKTYQKQLADLTIIGITGTNGKTTSAFLLYEALNKLGLKASYIGTLGFYQEKKVQSLPNTTPELLNLYEMMLDSLNKGIKYICMEVSSQGISYGRVKGIPFDYAIFTNLTQDHLDYHKTMENYALAKQKLFRQLKSNGKAIINNDDGYKDMFLLNENKNITYGKSPSDYQLLSSFLTPTGLSFTYKNEDLEYQIDTNLFGSYNIYNSLVGIIVLKDLGIPFDKIKEAFKGIYAPKGRMEMVLYNSNKIMIDYAHTPDALSKIIAVAKEMTKNNIYIVFGCTGDRDRTKRPIMMDIATKNAKYVIVTNDDPHNEDPAQIFADMKAGLKAKNYEICEDRKLAIEKGIGLLTKDDTLLILGKGHEEFMIVKDKKIPFQDRKVVEEVLERIKSKVVE